MTSLEEKTSRGLHLKTKICRVPWGGMWTRDTRLDWENFCQIKRIYQLRSGTLIDFHWKKNIILGLTSAKYYFFTVCSLFLLACTSHISQIEDGSIFGNNWSCTQFSVTRRQAIVWGSFGPSVIPSTYLNLSKMFRCSFFFGPQMSNCCPWTFLSSVC